jgi:precorrin-6A/cobalt-precorrin-6A reductase
LRSSPSIEPRSKPLSRILLLGGTSEASRLARALAGRRDVEAVLSLAGRTSAPPPQPLPMRIGGFGGVDGLVSHLQEARIDILVDATHPFATQISYNAREAARRVGCALVAVSRPAWSPQRGDRWREVASMAEAAAALGSRPRRVFLTVGSLQLNAFRQLAHQHHYLVRTIDPVSRQSFPHADFIEAKGPFAPDAEEKLMRDHRIELLVTKNSGGQAAVAKLTAARRLGLDVILVARPAPHCDGGSVEDALARIDAHVAAVPRGV